MRILKKKIKSSTISNAEYDIITKELLVTFNTGATYKYTLVPLDIYIGLTTAKSAGGYFWRMIRDKYVTAKQL